MGIYEYLESFGGLPVADLRPANSPAASAKPGTQPPEYQYGQPPVPYGIAPDEYAPDAVAWRLRYRHWEDDEPYLPETLAYFQENVDTTRVTALVIGAWTEDLSEECPAIPWLIENAERFPALRHLFIGEALQEESELAWIEYEQELTPLLDAYPLLETFEMRGGPLGDFPARHESLRRLRFESAGLGAAQVRSVGACELPALEHLELWMGVEWNGFADDALSGVLSGVTMPNLRHLGLLNSEFQDEIAAAIASAPIVPRLTGVDLSMGTLGDEGAEALLGGQPLGHLERFSVLHHFMSEPMAERLRTTLRERGVEVTLSPPEPRRDWGRDGRFVEIAE